MITVTRAFEFDAGHRVMGHEGKCRFLHGHRYKALVTIAAPFIDKIGRVVDFGQMKQSIGEWIDNNWDHRLLLNHKDKLLTETNDILVHFDQLPYLMKYGNPTAENMARELFDVCKQLVSDTGLIVTRVRLYETPNCHADYMSSREDDAELIASLRKYDPEGD